MTCYCFRFRRYKELAADQAIEIEHLRKRVAELEKQNAHLAMLAAETGTGGKAAPDLIQIATPGGVNGVDGEGGMGGVGGMGSVGGAGGAGGEGGEGGARKLKVCSSVPDSVHSPAPPPT